MIKMSCTEVKTCAKCRGNIYTTDARKNLNSEVVHLKGQCVAKQANTVQKKWMTTITEWALNGGLRLLYGDQWEFAKFERHHVLGKTAKHNKVAIGHEFILPVPYMLHNIREKNSLNVSYFKNNFTNQFGTQRSLFMKMCDDMFEQGYDLTVIPLDVARAIQDTNA